ncbi:NAD(P)-binding protein [Favolaschia claudopus]|uniref:NAD(P)-binding protein n=1 Tax=Favolaschia claudopus TaxID=2862362 RepID=A0AAW0EDK1_9AGAR
MSSYVVTGAAKGIGLEFVNQLSANSSNTVFAIVRNKNKAPNVEALERKNIHIVQADCTDGRALLSAAEEVGKVTGGKLDYLIANAGGSNHPGVTMDGFATPEDLEKDLIDNYKFNAISTAHTINAFLPLLKKGSAKRVMALSSGLGDLDLTLASGMLAEPSYSIAKAALNMVVAKYAAQYKDEGFVFLAMSPGIVNTGADATNPGIAAEMKMLAAGVPKIAPDFKGPITPEVSVKMQLEVFNRWTVEESGAFVSHMGNKVWI